MLLVNYAAKCLRQNQGCLVGKELFDPFHLSKNRKEYLRG